jgi:DNA-binding XRE family transcriptional regulator
VEIYHLSAVDHHLSRVVQGSPVKEVSPIPMHEPPRQLDAFGRTLRRQRRALDLSQEALAAASGVSAKHIGEIERANKNPRMTTVMLLIGGLRLPLGEFFGQVDLHLQEE